MDRNATFPQQLTDSRVFEIARALLDGFDRHYKIFSETSAQSKRRFEDADWHGQQTAQRVRIEFYDLRVKEAVERLENDYGASTLPMEVWHQIKLFYIGLLTGHRQPELAETFFNSVTIKILDRKYYRNDFIFVRPAVSTEYIDDDEEGGYGTFRAYYPTRENLLGMLKQIVLNYELRVPFDDLDRDVRLVYESLIEQIGHVRLRTNFQIQVLSSLFYRNKGAYIVGKMVNGFRSLPFAIPILHNSKSRLYIDAALFGEDDLLALFSFARAYFMVHMPVPSAYVQFLRSLMPRKPRAELYNAIGLQKHGKNLFYRDFLFHLRHSGDKFRIAPGIKGMVMLVFDLPSYPFVFKVIKDYFPPQKEITREGIKGKYQLVKQHDRVGRMADSLEFTNVAFPLHRFDEELIDELKKFAPSVMEVDHEEQTLVIKHLYIERRMIPLNIYIQEAEGESLEHAVIEYGNALKDLVAANIFPGDMLWKNFGVTRNGKVVFYDYDEIEYVTDCNFRKVPTPRNEEEEMSGEIWYSVGPRDVFPETFGPFLLGDPRVRRIFMKHHGDLLEPEFWQQHQQRIREGYVHDVFPYDRGRRFIHRIQNLQALIEPSAEVAPVEEPVEVPPLGSAVHDQGTLSGFQSGGTSSAD
ncbi:MAG: bifunctional isocitrate dehydrogenase kinase/phosphatase [Aquabacterium sp.]|jgi:isocitrate dehydrogenase kinase/phosphatase|uniref:bifunctional isocitrate dehydrogenase kinase/phosphatase n=1 Tax=Aquabacterium sp. TaxID=1872578 RepID=UPI002A35C8C6|nr:bifunctional isocitrate dehydrogenase kinase/phosphatase [Aquabacterium sp.]MDX9842392.1 bifunctional isocitrate dehydrogenase kinase/phosphatase [Aquabacterium sp.]